LGAAQAVRRYGRAAPILAAEEAHGLIVGLGRIEVLRVMWLAVWTAALLGRHHTYLDL
jgi:hypothetical protein